MTAAQQFDPPEIATVGAATATTSMIVLVRMACQAIVLILTARLLVLGLIATRVTELSAGQWGWAYLVAALLSLTFSLAYLKWHIGINAASKRTYLGISDGVYFAAQSARTAEGACRDSV